MFQSVRLEKFAFFIGQAYDALKLLEPERSSPALFGPQRSCMMRCAVGSMRLAGIMLPGNGSRVAVFVATFKNCRSRVVDRPQPARPVQRLREVADALEIGRHGSDRVPRFLGPPSFVSEERE